MTLTFGQDVICRHCRGEGFILGGRMECQFCHGSGISRPVARMTDPETSHHAAEDAEPRAGTNRAKALAALRDHPEGLTDFELADLTGVAQTSIGVRRHELEMAGFVEDSGLRRPAPSGSQAIVWRARLS
jgi:DNA-binding transcriptional ArsR family regulator